MDVDLYTLGQIAAKGGSDLFFRVVAGDEFAAQTVSRLFPRHTEDVAETPERPQGHRGVAVEVVLNRTY